MAIQVLHVCLVSAIFFLVGCTGLSKEAAKPVETKKADSVIEQFGFKTRYHFRQAQIDVDDEARKAGLPFTDLDQLPDVLHFVIRTKVLPAILELEHRELINGFYEIVEKVSFAEKSFLMFCL